MYFLSIIFITYPNLSINCIITLIYYMGDINEEFTLNALRVAMWIHAFLDLSGAIALFFTPNIVQTLAPTLMTTPFTLRIIAGVLFAIAYVSARAVTYNKLRQYKELLQFKIVWSTTVWIGILWSALERLNDGLDVPAVAWITFGIFLTGSIIWNSLNYLVYRFSQNCRQNRNKNMKL